MLRWRIALLLSAAIAISYLDRQTLPVAIKAIAVDIPISNQVKAFLDSAFLFAYALMYLGGGKLMDVIGTRRGFALTMVVWSLACASHGLAISVTMLAVSRLLLGLGEGGGFPAATRAIAEWFPVRERSIAMGIINAGSAVGGIVAPPLIWLVIAHTGWFHLTGWRWVFFITGGAGMLWAVWWLADYHPPGEHGGLGAAERAKIALTSEGMEGPTEPVPYRVILSFPETWGLMSAKFFSDAAWFFYLFWLPKYLYDAHHFDIKAVGSIAWIPHAAAGVGCLCGGVLSSLLLFRGRSLNFSRKLAMAVSVAMMPLLILVPHVSVKAAIVLFCVGYFGQQSWSTLVMILPTDLFPKRAVGTIAGLIGFSGAMGGVVFGQLAGFLLDHGAGYGPVFAIFGSLHVIALTIILAVVRQLKPLLPRTPAPAFEVQAIA